MASSFQFSIIYVLRVMFHFGVFFTYFVYFMLNVFYLSGHDKVILVVIT